MNPCREKALDPVLIHKFWLGWAQKGPKIRKSRFTEYIGSLTHRLSCLDFESENENDKQDISLPLHIDP